MYFICIFIESQIRNINIWAITPVCLYISLFLGSDIVQRERVTLNTKVKQLWACSSVTIHGVLHLNCGFVS